MPQKRVRPYIPVETAKKISRSCELNGEIYDDLVALRDKVYEMVNINEDIITEIEIEQDYIRENLDVIVKTREFQLDDKADCSEKIVKRFEKLLDKLDAMVMNY